MLLIIYIIVRPWPLSVVTPILRVPLGELVYVVLIFPAIGIEVADVVFATHATFSCCDHLARDSLPAVAGATADGNAVSSCVSVLGSVLAVVQTGRDHHCHELLVLFNHFLLLLLDTG